MGREPSLSQSLTHTGRHQHSPPNPAVHFKLPFAAAPCIFRLADFKHLAYGRQLPNYFLGTYYYHAYDVSRRVGGAHRGQKTRLQDISCHHPISARIFPLFFPA